MPSFLDDISSFYGTGEKNEKGQTLEEFLKEYDPYQYKNPCATTDMVLFSYAGEKPDTDALKVLLSAGRIIQVSDIGHCPADLWNCMRIWKIRHEGNWRRRPG